MRTATAKAEQGYTEAQYAVGLACLTDETSDPVTARHWLSLSAAKGYVPARELLAYGYAHDVYGGSGTSEAESSTASPVSVSKPRTGFSQAAQRLCEYMEWLSEECWCAGWYDALEFDLWAACGRGGQFRYGAGLVARIEMDVLRGSPMSPTAWSCGPTMPARSLWIWQLGRPFTSWANRSGPKPITEPAPASRPWSLGYTPGNAPRDSTRRSGALTARTVPELGADGKGAGGSQGVRGSAGASTFTARNSAALAWRIFRAGSVPLICPARLSSCWKPIPGLRNASAWGSDCNFS